MINKSIIKLNLLHRLIFMSSSMHCFFFLLFWTAFHFNSACSVMSHSIPFNHVNHFLWTLMKIHEMMVMCVVMGSGIIRPGSLKSLSTMLPQKPITASVLLFLLHPSSFIQASSYSEIPGVCLHHLERKPSIYNCFQVIWRRSYSKALKVCLIYEHNISLILWWDLILICGT